MDWRGQNIIYLVRSLNPAVLLENDIASQAPCELMLLDACMSRFALNLQRFKEACPFARSAVKQMELISPGSPELRQLQSILEYCSLNMKKSSLTWQGKRLWSPGSGRFYMCLSNVISTLPCCEPRSHCQFMEMLRQLYKATHHGVSICARK